MDSRNDGENEFWVRFHQETEDCECECISVSPLSPGRIEEHEAVASVITHAKYVSREGNILPNISDRIKNGLSADRINYTDQASFDRRAIELVADDEKKVYLGIAVFSVCSVRNIRHDGNRCYAIYDTALPENYAHSELSQTNYPSSEGLTKNQRKEIRAEIRSRILEALLYDGRMVKSEQAFEG